MILGLVIIVLIIFLIGSCNRMANLDNDLDITEQNRKALVDSVRVTENKVGDLEYSINILITEKKGLTGLNQDLANELKKEKGKVFELNKIIAQFVPDTVYAPVEVIVYKPVGNSAFGVYGFKMKYDTTYDINNYRSLECLTKVQIDTNFCILPLSGQINRDVIGFDLITGLRELDGNIEIFARSNYPDLTITNMTGSIINPKTHPVLKKYTKPKHFGIGPFIGVSLSYENNSDKPLLKRFSPACQIGVGLQYSLFRF